MPAALFPKPPKICFAPEQNTCSCGSKLCVQKTKEKTVISMTGPFIAHETILECKTCLKTFKNDSLPRIVQLHCNVAYDVLIFIGRSLFLKHRSTQEVRAELADRNVRLCTSEINYLGRKFISLLAIAHRMATPRIRHKMALNGGYVLHLDATHEGDAPALMTGLDGLSKFVLANVKIPSENSTHIVPFLNEIKATYGTPRACVHDMGTGLCKAVAEVFPKTPDYICHFHFLRDIGKDYLDPAYRELRNRLRSHATTSCLRAIVRDCRQKLNEQCSQVSKLVKSIHFGNLPKNSYLLPLATCYSLSLWALQAKNSGNGYGFPFDLPLLDFAQRLLELDKILSEIIQHFIDNTGEKKPIFKLKRLTSEIVKDSSLCHAVEELLWRKEIFDTLRKAMRIALPDGGKGLNDDGSTETMSSIKQQVELFRKRLDTDSKLVIDPLSRKMAEQLDKYNEKLFAGPIEVETPDGKITIYPQRTNNILEQFFRNLKRGQRRKTGNNSMSRTLRAMLADTPLVKNLDNPDYMKILLDGKSSLEELFSELSKIKMVENDDNSQLDINEILPGFRRLIKLKKLPEKLLNSFITSEKMDKSN